MIIIRKYIMKIIEDMKFLEIIFKISVMFFELLA